MSFFRRKKKDEPVPVKKVAVSGKPVPKTGGAPSGPSPKPSPGPAVPERSDEEGRPSNRDTGNPASPVPPTEPAPVAPVAPTPTPPARPATAPPPLPDPAPRPEGPASIVPAPRAYCFVCGSALDEGRCPTCRMTWVE
jgi:hypothetical protein